MQIAVAVADEARAAPGVEPGSEPVQQREARLRQLRACLAVERAGAIRRQPVAVAFDHAAHGPGAAVIPPRRGRLVQPGHRIDQRRHQGRI